MIAPWVSRVKGIWQSRGTGSVFANQGIAAGRDIRGNQITIINENPETLRKFQVGQNEIRELLAREKGVDPYVLIPLFEHLGQKGLTLDDMRARAGEAIEALLALARQPVEPTRDGADIDATITAARDKLGRLDTAGARSVLATKIAAEDAARRRRLVPLLEEQAIIERLSYDYEAAKATLRQLLALEPERVWSWIELGDLFVTTGSLNQADEAYHQARAVAERLAKADPGNAGWQRDLSVSQGNIGDVQVAQGNLPAALTSFQASLGIRERLAKADPGNAGWQRDLALSFGRVAMIDAQQGAGEKALGAFRQGRDIIARLGRQSPDNATLPKDLAWFDHQIAAQSK